MGVTRELNSTATADEVLRQTLNQLEAELRQVNATVAHKQQLLDDYLTSGFKGIGLKSLFFFSRNLFKIKENKIKQPEINLLCMQISLRRSRGSTRSRRRLLKGAIAACQVRSAL